MASSDIMLGFVARKWIVPSRLEWLMQHSGELIAWGEGMDGCLVEGKLKKKSLPSHKKDNKLFLL